MVSRHRSSRTRTLARTLFRSSRNFSPKVVKRQRERIVDKLQILMLRRPNMLDIVERVLDGLLSEKRHDDEDNEDE